MCFSVLKCLKYSLEIKQFLIEEFSWTFRVPGLWNLPRFWDLWKFQSLHFQEPSAFLGLVKISELGFSSTSLEKMVGSSLISINLHPWTKEKTHREWVQRFLQNCKRWSSAIPVGSSSKELWMQHKSFLTETKKKTY